MSEDVYTVHGAQTPINNSEHANTLGVANAGLENCVCEVNENEEDAKFWNGNDYAETLKANCDRDRMPDKGKLNAVLCYNPQDPQSKRCFDPDGAFPAVTAYDNGGGRAESVLCRAFQQNTRDEVRFMQGNGEVAGALSAEAGAKQQNYVQCYDARGNGDGETANTITGDHPNRVTDYTPVAVAIGENVIGRQPKNGGHYLGAQEELAYTQNTTGVMGVCTKGNGDAFESDVHTSLSAAGGGQAGQGFPAARVGATVRRLLPIETERLMGFPEVDVLEIGKMTKDEFIAWEIAVGNIIVNTKNGKVYSTRTGGGRKSETPILLDGSETPTGYLVVSLREKSLKKQCRVHRIVWIAAHGIPPVGMVIDHINNDKKDNRLANLQLLTPEDNSHKAREDGLYLEGEDSPRSKISDAERNEIVTLYNNGPASMREIGALYGIGKSRVSQLVKKHGWTQIPWKGKPAEECPDSPRYKACGNSMCVNVMRWIGMRIELVERKMAK